MKTASFNANSIRSRLPIILKWLNDNAPDILCLQETKVQDHDFPHEAFADTGYHYAFKGEKSYNGVAIFSREKIDDIEYGFDSEPNDKARLIKAVIGPITVVNTYIPQGVSPDSEKFQYKLQWFERLAQYFAKKFNPSQPVLWMGDFNIAPEPRDVYDPDGLLGSVCYHPKVHKALAKIMQWGFEDIFRLHCQKDNEYTFWDYRVPNAFKRDLGWRLDHIMATKVLAEKSTTSYIDKQPRLAEKPSDHTFLIAEFKL